MDNSTAQQLFAQDCFRGCHVSVVRLVWALNINYLKCVETLLSEMLTTLI